MQGLVQALKHPEAQIGKELEPSHLSLHELQYPSYADSLEIWMGYIMLQLGCWANLISLDAWDGNAGLVDPVGTIAMNSIIYTYRILGLIFHGSPCNLSYHIYIIIIYAPIKGDAMVSTHTCVSQYPSYSRGPRCVPASSPREATKSFWIFSYIGVWNKFLFAMEHLDVVTLQLRSTFGSNQRSSEYIRTHLRCLNGHEILCVGSLQTKRLIYIISRTMLSAFKYGAGLTTVTLPAFWVRVVLLLALN